MPDRFTTGRAALDGVEAPDIWDDAVGRAQLDNVRSAGSGRGPSRRALAVAAATVVLVLAAAAVLAEREDGRVATTPDLDPTTTSSTPTTAPVEACQVPGVAPVLLATTSPPAGFSPGFTRPTPPVDPGPPPRTISSFSGPDGSSIEILDGPLPEPPEERGVQTPVGFGQVGERGGEAVATLHLEAFGASCTLGLVGRGVSADALYEFLSGLYLADDLGRPLLHPDGAVWPETAGGTVGVDQPAWRSDERETALEFARQVLGWEDAVAPVELSEPSEDGHIGGVYGIVRTDHPGQVSVFVAPTLGGRWFGVYHVGFRCCVEDQTASVLVDGSTGWATAGPPPPEAVGTVVRFDHGGRIASGTLPLDGDAAPFDLGYTPDTTGSVLVLFVDGTGEVVGAWGTSLPAGDFAAG
jgi:hypothetical protein